MPIYEKNTTGHSTGLFNLIIQRTNKNRFLLRKNRCNYNGKPGFYNEKTEKIFTTEKQVITTKKQAFTRKKTGLIYYKLKK